MTYIERRTGYAGTIEYYILLATSFCLQQCALVLYIHLLSRQTLGDLCPQVHASNNPHNVSNSLLMLSLHFYPRPESTQCLTLQVLPIATVTIMRRYKQYR